MSHLPFLEIYLAINRKKEKEAMGAEKRQGE